MSQRRSLLLHTLLWNFFLRQHLKKGRASTSPNWTKWGSHKSILWCYQLLKVFCRFIITFFSKILFIFKEGKGERERNNIVWLPVECPLLGTWPTTQACVLIGNRTSNSLVCWLALGPLSHTSEGHNYIWNEKMLYTYPQQEEPLFKCLPAHYWVCDTFTYPSLWSGWPCCMVCQVVFCVWRWNITTLWCWVRLCEQKKQTMSILVIYTWKAAPTDPFLMERAK